MHTQDCTLRRIHNGRSHHAPKHAPVRHSERAALTLLGRDLIVLGLDPEVPDVFFDVSNALLAHIAHHGDQQSFGSTDGHRNVDLVPVDDFVVADDRVHDRIGLEGLGTGFQEEPHETQFDVVFLHELVLELFAHVYHVAHVDFVEGRQESIRVLGLFQALAHLPPEH